MNLGISSAVSAVVVQHHDSTLSWRKHRLRDDLAVLHPANHRAGYRRRDRDPVVMTRQHPGHQPGEVVAASSLPVRPSLKPGGLTWVSGAQRLPKLVGILAGRERAGQGGECVGIKPPKHRRAVELSKGREAGVSVEREQGDIADREALGQPLQPRHLLTEHATQQHRVGGIPDRADLIVRHLRQLIGGPEEDGVLRVVVEEAMRASGQLCSRSVGDDRKQGRSIRTQGGQEHHHRITITRYSPTTALSSSR